MKPTRFKNLFWCVCLAVVVFAAGCAHVTKPKSTKAITRPGQAAAAANDFPSAIQAGIPSQNVKK